jgi:hypothetical protein
VCVCVYVSVAPRGAEAVDEPAARLRRLGGRRVAGSGVVRGQLLDPGSGKIVLRCM